MTQKLAGLEGATTGQTPYHQLQDKTFWASKQADAGKRPKIEELTQKCKIQERGIRHGTVGAKGNRTDCCGDS
jgi:hypothetical protein